MTSPVPSPAMAPAHSTAGPASVATSVQTIGLLGTSCGLAASAGTAARAVAMRDNTAIIPIFLNIKVFLLYLVGLYCSLRTGACLRHCLRAVEWLFAGAGRTCVALSLAQTSVRPLPLVIASYASLPSSPPFLFSLSLAQNKTGL